MMCVDAKESALSAVLSNVSEDTHLEVRKMLTEVSSDSDSDSSKDAYIAKYGDMKRKFGMTDYDIAAYVNNLDEDDFLETMLEIGRQNGCKTDEDAILWLALVLIEMKDIRDRREAGDDSI